MSWADGAWHRLRVVIRGERYAREQQEELRVHLELEAMQHQADGAATARRRLGNLASTQERLREAAGFGWLDRLQQDLTYAVRGLRRSPAFTATVVITLALGVGANAAMFSFLDRVFFRPPGAVLRPGEVHRVYVHERDPFATTGSMRAMQRFTYAEYESIQRSVNGFDVAADIPQTWNRRADTLPQTGYVSGNYFSVLGLRPSLGRFFSPQESAVEVDARVAVITHALWKKNYALNPGVLKKKITVRGVEYAIIGVTPEGFDGVDIAVLELMLPLRAFPTGPDKPWYQDSQWSPLRPLIRAKGPISLAGASEAYRQVTANKGHGLDTTTKLVTGPLVAAMGPAQNDKEISLSARLAGVTLVVLIIACANVASLLLVRATKRRREIAVRLALGVSRKRLWSQLLTESLLLAGVGCALALIVAKVAGTALRKLLLPSTLWSGPALDTRVVVFTVTTALIVGVVAGLFPAFQAVHTDLNDAMKSGTRSTAARGSFTRSSLLVAQGALSIVLLVAAGLCIRTLDNIRSLPLGFDATRMVWAGVVGSPSDNDSAGPRISLALSELAHRMSAVPGVRAAALTSDVPMASNRSGWAALPDRPGVRLPSYASYVAADFFAAADMPFVAGRAFTREEAENQAAVVVVNQSFARMAWPHENAVGKCLNLGMKATTCTTVVGVTHDARSFQIIETRPAAAYFVPLSATVGYTRPNYVVINADPGQGAAVMKRARDELAQLLPGATGIRATRTSEQLAPQYRPWELGARLFTTLGLLALLVAAIGVYSIVAYSVSQRTQEMGVRVALGAQTRDVLDLVVGEGMRVMLMGVGLGVVAAIALGRVVASQLFGVSTRDPYVMVGAASVLMGVALVACLIPAWRASRVAPVDALRTE